VLSKNLTLSYNAVVYQIETKRPAYTLRAARVEVRETSTGGITIEYKRKRLAYRVWGTKEQQQAAVIPTKHLNQRLEPTGKRKNRSVPLTHPWRYFDFTENSMLARERRGELCILRR
jgi:hypothetical protein